LKYYLIAGEASGDLHGANLIKALKIEDSQAQIQAWGGDLMQEAGATLRKHFRDLAFMGFLEVVKNLRTILNNLDFCKKDILAFQPDALVLIDYPGFNLRMAEWAKKQGIKVFYYISPQVWAWHSSRVKAIKRDVDRMYVILPFEEEFYAKHDYQVVFVGHPLLDVVNRHRTPADWCKQNGLSEDPIIALLPGSRRQEISRMLEVMLDVVDKFPQFQFVVAGAPAIPEDFYEKIIEKKRQTGNVMLLKNQTYDLLTQSHAAVVTSGTATLETALFGIPEVVVYKGNSLSYAIAKRLVEVKFISLVNLIMDRELVKELIQDDCTPETIRAALDELLKPGKYQHMQVGYRALKGRLGNAGAAVRAAGDMVGVLRNA
jgi:lipid-A-disaccharide synthase